MTAQLKAVEVEKKKRTAPRPKVFSVHTPDIVDCWKLLDASIQESKSYPDCSLEPAQKMQHVLFQYLAQPTFAGLMAKVGRKPVGMILADVQRRPFGAPSVYAQVWTLWVDPEYRAQGVGKLLWTEFKQRLAQAGVRHWESLAGDKITDTLVLKGQGQKLCNRIGGSF